MILIRRVLIIDRLGFIAEVKFNCSRDFLNSSYPTKFDSKISNEGDEEDFSIIFGLENYCIIKYDFYFLQSRNSKTFELSEKFVHLKLS